MRLQTDPTVIYGLGDGFDGNLTRQHLRDGSNPWNTYQITGLPPSPIALPGAAAVRAAVNPEPGTDLYFVAKGDGYHAFASTLEEHNANVREYQLGRKKNYRSTPKDGSSMTAVTGSPRFITVEGGEGVGKSTQLACIERCLKARGIPLVVTREPGGTPLAEQCGNCCWKGAWRPPHG